MKNVLVHYTFMGNLSTAFKGSSMLCVNGNVRFAQRVAQEEEANRLLQESLEAEKKAEAARLAKKKKGNKKKKKGNKKKKKGNK